MSEKDLTQTKTLRRHNDNKSRTPSQVGASPLTEGNESEFEKYKEEIKDSFANMMKN